MLNAVLNFFYPPRCAVCEAPQPLDADRNVCLPCRESIERITQPFCSRCGVPLTIGSSNLAEICQRCRQSPPEFSSARSALRYRPSAEMQEGTVGSMLRRLKYGRDRSLARALEDCIANFLPFEAGMHDAVVPVPLHRTRLRWRSFNQATLLALIVAKRLDCPCKPTVLARTRSTPPQTMLDHRMRARNVRRAFAVLRPSEIDKRRILLVDDVMTTGATVDECARVLIQAGAISVDVFTLARAL
jgi:ComF family protein